MTMAIAEPVTSAELQVQSSDQAVARDVKRGGARVVAAVVLSRLLGRS